MSASPPQAMSPDEARTHLRDVDAVEQTAARWHPATWAVAIFAVAFGTSVGALLAEHYWVLLGSLAALALIHALLRNQLLRPGVRTRDDLIGTDQQWWKRNSLLLWALILAPTLRGFTVPTALIGVLAVLAAAHAWYCAAVVWPEGSRA
ncbi:hypothetical protein [Actinomyces ruminicola]|uniref:Uncharacterized protein n=1 Tax=Actinomyces ruminicola TaxID=332524 RepID=A0A1G9ZBQ5_9ACTO|nr:hypothetical protein [Actinomyces ruminicola]SDN18870.1 hypothetical protein SAMN04487766_1175 [Actinomyces ruminicola]